MGNPLPGQTFVMAYTFLFEHVLNQPIKKLNPDFPGSEKINEKDFVWYLTALGETSGGRNLFFRSSGRIGAKYRRSARTIKSSWRKLGSANLLTPKVFRLRSQITEREMEFSTHREAIDFLSANKGWDFSTTKYEVTKPEEVFRRLGLKSNGKILVKSSNKSGPLIRKYRQNEQSAWAGPQSKGVPKSKNYSLNTIKKTNNKE